MKNPTTAIMGAYGQLALLLSTLTTGVVAQSPIDGVLVQPGSVTLNCSYEAFSWQIQLDNTPSYNSGNMIDLQGPGYTMSIPGLLNNTTYYWHFRTSYNSWDPFGQTFSFTTSSTALGTPALTAPLAQAAGLGPTSVSLSWGTASGATGYQVQVDEAPGFTYVQQTFTDNASPYMFASTAAKRMYWRVRGTNGTTMGPWSVFRSFYAQTTPIALAMKVFLQGPLVTATLIMNELGGGVLPNAEPYTALGFTGLANAGASVSSSFYSSLSGNDRIVDWILIELRTGTTTAYMFRYALLLQRDGDIVTTTGAVPSLAFPSPYGQIAIRHRNHLGVLQAYAFNTTSLPSLDFTQTSTELYGTDPTAIVSGTRRALWSGDTNGDGSVKYTGAGNDRDPILLRVGSTTPNSTVSGYFREDVNMEGVTKYTGANNDRDPVLTVIGSTTPNSVRTQQLP